ncbi:hypothetical protein, partial [Ralstonia sp. SET104]|uniref:hypothetical protein n=1 Tax=Ralstonia sp. SET104 TaxID=2448774 RepID=UPI001C8A21E0
NPVLLVMPFDIFGKTLTERHYPSGPFFIVTTVENVLNLMDRGCRPSYRCASSQSENKDIPDEKNTVCRHRPICPAGRFVGVC